MSVLGTHLYQCTSWHCCDRMHLASVNIFLKTLSMCLPFSWWVIYECTCPYHGECSAVFEQKQHDPHSLSSLFTWSCPKWLFNLFPQVKNVHKGKCFADVEEVKQKTAETLKSIKIDESNCFEQWKKNVSIGILHQMESTLKVTGVWTYKKKPTIFYK